MKVNWKYFKHRLVDLDITITEMSEKIGKSKSYLSRLMSTGENMPDNIADILIDKLGCTWKELDADSDVVEVADEWGETQFEKDVIDYLGKLTEKVENLNQAVMYLFNAEQCRQNGRPLEEVEEQLEQVDGRSDLDRATDLLGKMFSIANGGGIRYDDFVGRLGVLGIVDKGTIKEAIARTDCECKTTGYGNKKVKWIYKPVVEIA